MGRYRKPIPAVGDWVYSYSSGIWRVYRVIRDPQAIRLDLQGRNRRGMDPLVFSKRLVNKGWKAAFTSEMASNENVNPVSTIDKRRLDQFIAANPGVLREFEEFQPKPVDLLMDLQWYVSTSESKDSVWRQVSTVFEGIEDGLTNYAVLQRLAESELDRFDATHRVNNATLRFICRDYEVRGNEFMFREVQLLMV